MANDVPNVSIPMRNARFGRLLSNEEMAELSRRQQVHDARSKAPDGVPERLTSGVKAAFGTAGRAVDKVIAAAERGNARLMDRMEESATAPGAIRQGGRLVDAALGNAIASVVQPTLVGARAAIANVASGGGKYYTPETRDERYFSKAARDEIRRNLGNRRVEMSFRPGALEASQTVGGLGVRDEHVTDVFDINSHYDIVPDMMTKVVGGIFGRDADPDAGKIHTRVPFKALGLPSSDQIDESYRPSTLADALRWQEDAKGGDTRVDAKGGDTPDPGTEVSEPPVSEPAPQAQGGPRIVINPTTFKNKKDALCVAFNEGFRLWMEANDFQPQSEPTDRQRKFFSDTAYADDELQLRRTILARVATFDTSVKDPTDDQLSETAQFLDGVLESGWCKNEWEQDCVSRLSEAVKAAIGAEPVEPREGPLEPAQAEPLAPAGGEEVQALQGGGSTDDEEEDKLALQNSGQSDKVDQVEETNLAEREAVQAESSGMQPEAQEQAQEPAADQGAPTVQPAPPDAPQAGKPAESGEPTDEQVRQAETQNEKDLAVATKEYDRMKASGKLDDSRAFGEAARPKLTLASPVSPDSPGSIAYRGPRKGDISQPIVGEDSPGSIAYKGPRKGDISRPIVDAGSPGSMSFSGTRQGGIEGSVVDPGSAGSISNPVLSYAPGSIESPVDDPRRREERRKRRDRRRRGLL